MATEQTQSKDPHKVWSGLLTFGMVTVPVILSTAAREERVSFNQLHAACNGRLKQQPMFCPACKVAVEKDQIRKGYEIGKNSFVIVTPQELEAQEPAAAHNLELTGFVPAAQLDALYFESSRSQPAPSWRQAEPKVIVNALKAAGLVSPKTGARDVRTDKLVAEAQA